MDPHAERLDPAPSSPADDTEEPRAASMPDARRRVAKCLRALKAWSAADLAEPNPRVPVDLDLPALAGELAEGVELGTPGAYRMGTRLLHQEMKAKRGFGRQVRRLVLADRRAEREPKPAAPKVTRTPNLPRVLLPRARSREQSHAPRSTPKAAARRSGDSGDDPGGEPEPALALAPPPKATIYTFAVLTPERRGAA
jgi:hypothetical protein